MEYKATKTYVMAWMPMGPRLTAYEKATHINKLLNCLRSASQKSQSPAQSV